MCRNKQREGVFTLLIVSVIVFAVLPVGGYADDGDDTDFAAKARKLGPSNPRKDRLDALEWLEARYSQSAAQKVMPLVERCLKKDTDASVRAKAATVLGLIAYRCKPPICPLAVVEALRDDDKEVRDRALDVASLFRTFAPGAADVLLRCAKKGDRNLRASVMIPLAAAGGREQKVLQFLREATADEDYLVRNNAHVALFKITGKLEDIVPYCLRVQLEFTNLPPLPPGASEEQKTEQCGEQLVQWATLSKLHEFEAKRGEELAKVLLRQLNQPSASERRAAAFVIGEYPALLEKLRRDDPRLLDVPADKNHKKDAPAPPKLLDRLRAIKVEEQLRKMARDDADKQVRAAAASALQKLVDMKEK